jgi:hypothetical protein
LVRFFLVGGRDLENSQEKKDRTCHLNRKRAPHIFDGMGHIMMANHQERMGTE